MIKGKIPGSLKLRGLYPLPKKKCAIQARRENAIGPGLSLVSEMDCENQD